MITTPLSTLTSVGVSLTSHMRRTQGETAKIQAEVASGRLFDVGQELGFATEALSVVRQEIRVLQQTIDVNAQLESRLDASQAALNKIVADGNGFLAALVSARADPRNAGIVAEQAQTGLKAFIEAANTSFGGVYLFSGLNTNNPPLADYFAGPAPPSRVAMDAAFTAEFGFSSTDPAVGTISVSSMQAFIDSAFSSQFSVAGWSANWTSSTQEASTSLISDSHEIKSSVSATEEAFRSIAAAFVLVADSGITEVNDPTYEVMIDNAVKLIGRGVALMGEVQSVLGSAQEQVSKASEAMKLRADVANEYVGRSEAVDLSELSVRLNTLLNQLEATYAVTGRIQRLSLLNSI